MHAMLLLVTWPAANETTHSYATQVAELNRTGWWQCAAHFLDHLSAVETDRMQFPERGKPGVGAMHIKASQKIPETWVLPVLYTSHHLCFSSQAVQMVGHRNMNTFTSYAKNRSVSIWDRMQ